MPTKQELVAQARALGEAIAQHEAVAGLRQAQQAVNSDETAQKLLTEYQSQAERIGKLQHEGQPIEVADKQKLADLEKAMPTNDAIRNLMRWQADYLDLMNQVNQAISGPLAATGPGGGDASGQQ